MKFPDQLQLPFALWTRVAIPELIWVRFGVKLSVRGVGEYPARWGPKNSPVQTAHIPHR